MNYLTDFIVLILLLNLWTMVGSWLFYFVLSDAELQEHSNCSCTDMILWPAMLSTIAVNRIMT